MEKQKFIERSDFFNHDTTEYDWSIIEVNENDYDVSKSSLGKDVDFAGVHFSAIKVTALTIYDTCCKAYPYSVLKLYNKSLKVGFVEK